MCLVLSLFNRLALTLMVTFAFALDLCVASYPRRKCLDVPVDQAAVDKCLTIDIYPASAQPVASGEKPDIRIVRLAIPGHRHAR